MYPCLNQWELRVRNDNHAVESRVGHKQTKQKSSWTISRTQKSKLRLVKFHFKFGPINVDCNWKTSKKSLKIYFFFNMEVKFYIQEVYFVHFSVFRGRNVKILNVTCVTSRPICGPELLMAKSVSASESKNERPHSERLRDYIFWLYLHKIT